MNTDNFKYELRLRSSARQEEQKPKSKKTPGQKTADKSIVCLLILIGVMFLKMSAAPGAIGVSEKLGELISHQMDLKSFAEDTMEALDTIMDEMEEKTRSIPVGADSILLTDPVSSGRIVSSFELGEHPVYSIKYAPAGIEIETPPGAFVFAGQDGSLIGIFETASGTLRACILTKGNQCLVYDGLGVCYFKENETVSSGSILGAMPTQCESALLSFGVYDEEGIALDPLSFIKGAFNEAQN